jgi:hypothetical protein
MNNRKLSDFTLAIADINVRVRCNNDKLADILRERYREFQSKSTIAFYAQIDWNGQDRHTSILDQTVTFQDGILRFKTPGYDGFIDEKKGEGTLQFSSTQPVDEIDYFLRVIFALLANANNGVLLHTAGIVRNGFAYLFFGHSGSGKTTVCRVSSSDYTIINDDLILLLPEGNSWRAYGTPFWNPTQIKPSAISAPVASMYLLIQAKNVAVYKLSASQAIAAMIANVPIIPKDPNRSVHLIDILSKIQQDITIHELHFLPDNSFWKII